MTDTMELRRRAEVAQDLARRARQMALGLGDSADGARLTQYASELEVQARQMIRQADRVAGSKPASLVSQHG
jgi:hypothetical protein